MYQLKNIWIAGALLLALGHTSDLFAGQKGAIRVSLDNYDWKKASGEHFFVYYTDDDKFAKNVLDKAEKYYVRIAKGLGYPRYSGFWTWDNRVPIYIFADHKAFIQATGQPEWSHGMADYTHKQIVSYAWGEGFVESLLPHEMAHLIFRDFVGFKGEIPLWLDEGVAQWAEESKREYMSQIAMEYYKEDKLLSIEDMMKLDIRLLKDMDRIYIRATKTREGKMAALFLDVESLVKTYYLESVAMINFMIDRFGAKRFTQFCRELRDGKKIEEALQSAYPNKMKNLDEFEERWREYLEEKLSS